MWSGSHYLTSWFLSLDERGGEFARQVGLADMDYKARVERSKFGQEICDFGIVCVFVSRILSTY